MNTTIDERRNEKSDEFSQTEKLFKEQMNTFKFGDEARDFDGSIELKWMPVVFQGYNTKPG